MPTFGFRDRRDAATLKQVARERQSKASASEAFARDRIPGDGLLSYLAIPLQTIPAASRAGGELVLGSGQVKIIRRNQAGTGHMTFEQTDGDGNRAIVTAYNPHPRKIIPSSESSGPGTNSAIVLVIAQETWGDFVIHDIIRFPGSSSSGSGSGSAGSGSNGSGSGSQPCLPTLDDATLADLPTVSGNDVMWIPVLTAAGCWGKVGVNRCNSGSGGSA